MNAQESGRYTDSYTLSTYIYIRDENNKNYRSGQCQAPVPPFITLNSCLYNYVN